MRLFVAVPVPEAARDAFSDLQSGLRVGRQVASDQFHITLAFFPEVPPQALAELDAGFEEIRAWPFDVAFTGVDIFGGARPRLLAAMVRPSPELDTVHRAVHGAARLAGLQPERQKFKPHVTLARFGARPPASLAGEVQRYLSENARAEIPGFTAQTITLTRSVLGGGAPVYDDLARYPFRPLPDGWDVP
ncbi:RNA 2',3'-cyclic phosphodiesterase [Marinovum sp.]|uniref:RNA 2',3'-cyclic phosphodiesterase n=1 Tax=Marinovum sp. TaxID=2024839 RepID=UPI002B2696EA|nr:RNA 2',3'-cyclic phosphodiesterase [Marinovum sp.]